jgi:hypothetical protein
MFGGIEMKKLIIIATMTGFMLGGVSTTAFANNKCKSTYIKVNEFWAKHGKKIMGAATKLIQMASKGENDGANFNEQVAKIEAETKKVQGKVNKWAGNSKFKIGPRTMQKGKWLDANTLTERTFLSSPVTANTATIHIDGKGGKGKHATITVCTVSPKNKYKVIKTIKLKNKKEFTKNHKIKIKKAAGQVISVLVKKPAGLRAFKYKVKYTQ